MSFALYLLGILLVVSGVAWGLVKAGLSTPYVIIACMILLGLGVMSAVNHTRNKDKSAAP